MKQDVQKYMDQGNQEPHTTELAHQVRGLRKSMFGLFLLWIITVLGMLLLFINRESGKDMLPADQVLQVRGLVVVDDFGTPRLQIGAPLPDAPILGKRINRESTAHGILLFDAEGNERGSFVTIDESGLIMLSLDETARMVAQFMALPAGGVRIRMMDQYQNEVILGTIKDGPYLKLKQKEEEVVFRPQSKEER